MLMRCPDARANVSRRTTRLCTNFGCREDGKSFAMSAWCRLTCLCLATWTPKPASQCLRHEELAQRRQRAALTGTSLPDLGLRHMTSNGGVLLLFAIVIFLLLLLLLLQIRTQPHLRMSVGQQHSSIS
jgi:hypothetical protein